MVEVLMGEVEMQKGSKDEDLEVNGGGLMDGAASLVRISVLKN